MCSLQLRSGTGLVKVAHLGEGEFLNDHPLLVQVMPLISPSLSAAAAAFPGAPELQ